MKLSSYSMIYGNIPDGRSEYEIGRFHHDRGLSLLAWIGGEIYLQARTAVGVWREAMLPQADPMVTAGENVISRIIGAAAGLGTSVPMTVLRPTSARVPAWWSAVWSSLLAVGRIEKFREMAFTVIAAMVVLDRAGGRYVSRGEWMSRYRPEGGRGSRPAPHPDGVPAAAQPSSGDAISADKEPAEAHRRGAHRQFRGGRFGGRGRARGGRFQAGRSSSNSRSNAYGSVSRFLSPLIVDFVVSSPTVNDPFDTASSAIALSPARHDPIARGSSSSRFASALDSPSCREQCADPGTAASVGIEQPSGNAPRPVAPAGNAPAPVAPADATVSVAPSSAMPVAPADAMVSVAPSSAIPGPCPTEEWRFTTLPGARAIEEEVRKLAASQHSLNVGRATLMMEEAARESGLHNLQPLAQAIADVRCFLDSSGFLHVDPLLQPPAVALSAVIRPLRSSAEAEALATKLLGSAAKEVGRDSLEGRWYHPLFVVPKSDGGRRLISDLRRVNCLFPQPPAFTYPSVRSIACGKRFGTKVDFKDAFYQPRVSEALSKAFSFVTSTGAVAAYTSLPMGWAWSPYMFDLVMRPLDIFCRAIGLTMVRYADDIVLLADSPGELARDLATLVALCRRTGWTISPSKSFFVAASILVFLGVVVDLHERAVSWSCAKRKRVRDACSAISSGSITTCLELQRVVGRLSFLLSAVPVFRVFLRGFVTASAGSEHTVVVSSALRAEAEFWLSAAGNEIATRWWLLPGGSRPLWKVATDASECGVGWGAIATPRGHVLPSLSLPLSRDLAGQSSAVREAAALTNLLEHLADHRREGEAVSAGDEVEVTLDARVVVQSVSRGSARAPQLVQQLRQLALTLLRFPPVLLTLRWVPREHNEEADAASRRVSLDEARLADAVFKELCDWWGCLPAADLFATAANRRAERYYSRDAAIGAEGVDGMRAPIIPRAYAYPPFALAPVFTYRLLDYAASSTPILAVVPADIALSVLRTWPLGDMKLFSAVQRVVVAPPYNLSPVPSPRQLAAVIVRVL